uniref:Uncharacterized protein n=1 Tax=Pseudomonas aeruginosa TaxID=287 RepID=A0A5P9WA16_PSEAI|nr:hypothetical protein pNK546KPC_0102 [Pseudomonas aeruginosa]
MPAPGLLVSETRTILTIQHMDSRQNAGLKSRLADWLECG